jgi:sigma-B regulation protein RsbU (phosphoserine phosphatase)
MNNIDVPDDYLKGIEKKLESFKTLMEVSAIISSTLDLDDLMTLVMEKAKYVMQAEACSILLYNRSTDKLEFEVALCADESISGALKKTISLGMGQGIAGWVAENKRPLVIDDVSKDSRFFGGADRLTGFTTKKLIAVPLIGRGGLIGVAEIINPGRKDYDMEMFELLCKQFAISIENALYHKESLARERLRQELEIASSLQKSFLPESPVLTRNGITVSAVNIPASQVGGDIYDFIDTASGKIGVLIGDVSGKGISAALFMAKIISDFRYIAHTTDSPGAVLGRLNSNLSRTPRGMFLTAIYMVVDASTGSLNISVAGHPPLLRLSEGRLTVMNMEAGPPLGILPMEYADSTLTLKKGDRIILLTDGVFEAKNKKGERIGFEDISGFIKDNIREEELIGKIVEHVNDFSEGADMADDLTILELRMI